MGTGACRRKAGDAARLARRRDPGENRSMPGRPRGPRPASFRARTPASRVRPAGSGRGRSASPTLIFATWALVLGAVVACVAWYLRLPPVVSAWLGLNAATLGLYAYDKAVAGRGRLRVPERVLHGLALCGGSLAALTGQRLFRHKVSKPAFQRVFVATLLVQLGLILGWLWWSR
jgi:uncharacterized membrane protein YsdA (DUF1294 family)